jgi:hypothetical protein
MKRILIDKRYDMKPGTWNTVSAYLLIALNILAHILGAAIGIFILVRVGMLAIGG